MTKKKIKVEVEKTELEALIEGAMVAKGIASIRDVEKLTRLPVDALRDIMRGKTKRNRLRKVDYLTRVASFLEVPPTEMARAAGILTVYDEKSHRATNLDLGTPEVQLRRSLLARGGDPQKCGYPLGILMSRFQVGQPGVSARQHDAGFKYASLYRAIATDCRPTMNSATLARIVHSIRMPPPPDNVVAMRQAMFRAADSAIRNLKSPAVYLETVKVCLLEELPEWAEVMPDEMPERYKKLKNGETPLRRGLDVLLTHFMSPAHYRIAEAFDLDYDAS